MTRRPSVAVFFPREEESWNAFAKRLIETEGDVIAVLSGNEERLAAGPTDLDQFLAECHRIRSRLRIASKHEGVITGAHRQGIRVLDTTRALKQALGTHESREEALRVFSPHVWRQELRTRLQAMGLLSLPKIRIWLLVTISTGLFFFVMLRLLPSSEIRIWPREDAVNQTTNIFLVQTGATVRLPERVRTMTLYPIVVTMTKSITFDQISKEFIGGTSSVPMTIINKSSEPYSLRSGTRLMNQAGMIFKILEPQSIAPGEEITVQSRADNLDIYGEIIGERGNVPADVKWEFPGLAPEERVLVYGENRVPAKGGTTSYRTVLQQSDLNLARKILEQELLATAKQLVDEEKILRNMEQGEKGRLELLYYDELTKIEFSAFKLPTQFLGEAVQSVPVEGTVTYRSFAYDDQAILDLLSAELESHVGTGKRLLKKTLTRDRMIAHVIDYADDLSWIKLTVDLTGTEQFVLDPLSPTGAKLSRKVREAVAGTTKEEAHRIVKNLPEVEKVEIRIWPPWSNTLPKILSHIVIKAEGAH